MLPLGIRKSLNANCVQTHSGWGIHFRCRPKRGHSVTKKPAERELLTAGVEGVDTFDLFEKCARQSTAKDSINASNPSRILMGLS